MLTEIQAEFEKVKEKDSSVKSYVDGSIKNIRKELNNLKSELEQEKNKMIVKFIFYI